MEIDSTNCEITTLIEFAALLRSLLRAKALIGKEMDLSGRIQNTWKIPTTMYLRNKSLGLPISQKPLAEEKMVYSEGGREKYQLQSCDL